MADIGISIGLQGISAYTRDLGATVNITITQMGRAGVAVNNVNSSFKSLAKEIPGLGRALSLVSNPIVAIGAAATGLGVAFKNAVKTSATFQQQVADTAALAGLQKTDAAYQDIITKARELGATTEFSATQAAQGFEELVKAGQTVSQVFETAPNALALATVGNIDLAKSADILTNILGQYGASADQSGRFVDVLAKTTVTANTNITQLADAFNYLGPTANALGVSLEESAAAVGILANSGLKGSLATRALGTALASLSSPKSKEAASEIKKIGLDAFDSQGNLVGFKNLIEQLEGAYAGYTKEQKIASLTTIFGAEAIQEFSILLEKGSTEFGKYTEELKAAGAQNGAFAKTIREVKLDTFQGAVKLLRSAWEELQLSLSFDRLPVLQTAVAGIAQGIRSIAGVIAGNVTFGDLFGEVGKQIDGLLTTVREFASGIITALAPIGQAFSASLGTGAGIIQSLLVPAISLLSGAIKVIGAVVAPVISEFSNLALAAVKVISAVATFPGALEAATVAFIGFKAAALLSGGGLATLVTQFKTLRIVQLAMAASSKIAAAAQVAFTTVTALLTGKIKLLTVAQRLFNFVLRDNPIGAVITAVSVLVGGIVHLYKTNEKARQVIDNAWQAIKQTYQAVADFISGFVSKVKATLSTFIDEFKTRIGGIAQIFKGIFTFDPAAIISGLNQVVNAAEIVATKAGEEAQAAFDRSVKTIRATEYGRKAGLQLAAGMADGAKQGVEKSLTEINKLERKLEELTQKRRSLIGIGGADEIEVLNAQIEATEGAIKRLRGASGDLDLTGPAKAARGSVAALNEQISLLNEQLNRAAPTTNVDSIQGQLKKLAQDVQEINLQRLGIKVDLTTKVDSTAVSGVEDQIERLRDQLKQAELTLTVNSEAANANLDKTRGHIASLKADIAGLEAAKINIQSGNSREIIQGIGLQIEALKNEIEATTLRLPDVQANPDQFKAVQADLSALQTQLDVLQGYKLELGGNDLPLLERQLQAVNEALQTLPASSGAFIQLKQQARELSDQISQVKVFRVLSDIDPDIPALKETLDVLNARLASRPEGAYFEALKAQIDEVTQKIKAELAPTLASVDLKPIKVPPIDLGSPAPPDFSQVTAATAQFVNGQKKLSEEFANNWKQAKDQIASFLVDEFASIIGQLGQDIGASIRQSFQPLKNESGETIADLQDQLSSLNSQLAESPNSAFTSQIESQIDTVKQKIAELNAQKITFGDAIINALKGFVNALLVEVPKMIGVFLIRQGLAASLVPGAGFLAGAPLMLAGAALVGFSGLIGGLLGGGSRSQQVATPSQAAAQGLTNSTRANGGLSRFNAGEEEKQDVVVNLQIVQDVDGIARTVEERIIRSEANVLGR